MHVDDILSCGTEIFQEQVMSQLRQKYCFGKVNRENFEYTGIHIYQNQEKEIFLDQDSFVNSLETFKYQNQHYDNVLSRTENKYLRRTTGQLN